MDFQNAFKDSPALAAWWGWVTEPLPGSPELRKIHFSRMFGEAPPEIEAMMESETRAALEKAEEDLLGQIHEAEKDVGEISDEHFTPFLMARQRLADLRGKLVAVQVLLSE